MNTSKEQQCYKISFLGDIALNGTYKELYAAGKNPFISIHSILEGREHIIGNLECLPKGNEGENKLKAPRLTTNIETLNFLNNIPVSVVCLAQNHIYDHLKDGYNKTIKFLDNNNIRYLGAGLSGNEASIPQLIYKEDISIAILNYVTQDTNPGIPEGADVYVNKFSLSKALSDIEKLKNKVDHIIAILHWGGRVEGGLYPDFDQRQIAHNLIDAGASLIVGHHSHTFQPYEKYKGKYIFYSLGNFCFSDFVFDGKAISMPARRKVTALVHVDFKKDNYQVAIEYYHNKLTHFDPIKNYKIRVRLRNFIYKYLLRIRLIWSLYYLSFKMIYPTISFMNRKDLSFREKLIRIYNSIKKKINLNI